MLKSLTILLISGLLFSACKENNKQSEQDKEKINSTNQIDEISTSFSIDENGIKLDMLFNHSKGTLSLTLNGETIKLVNQKAASGIWYKNDKYELRSKGDEVKLFKDGKSIFKSK